MNQISLSIILGKIFFIQLDNNKSFLGNFKPEKYKNNYDIGLFFYLPDIKVDNNRILQFVKVNFSCTIESISAARQP